MRHDLKTPCKNCPFRTDETRIIFSCRERAAEIAESAYRNGFPCHLSAEHVEDDDYGRGGGYYAGDKSQYCAGHAIMMLHDNYGSPWPGIDNDEDLYYKLCNQMDMKAPVFESEEEFLIANTNGREKMRSKRP